MARAISGPGVLVAATVALAGPSAAFAAATAPVIQVDKSFGKIAGWSIGYSGTTGGCLAAATFGDATTIWFGLTGPDGAFVAFTNPKWRSIALGQSYTINLVARGNGNWVGNFAGFEHEGQKGSWPRASRRVSCQTSPRPAASTSRCRGAGWPPCRWSERSTR